MSTKYEADRFPKMLLTEHSFGGLKTSQKMTAVASLTCPGCGVVADHKPPTVPHNCKDYQT